MQSGTFHILLYVKLRYQSQKGLMRPQEGQKDWPEAYRREREILELQFTKMLPKAAQEFQNSIALVANPNPFPPSLTAPSFLSFRSVIPMTM